MIIKCVNCDKKFNVNSELIPNEGRTIQCGSCNHVWFYKKKQKNQFQPTKSETKKNTTIETKKNKKKIDEDKSEDITQKGSEIVEYTPVSNFTFGKFLSYIIVILISFVALIIILDTFKIQLYNFFPDLETWLFSLYEILKDIKLFIKDLI